MSIWSAIRPFRDEAAPVILFRHVNDPVPAACEVEPAVDPAVSRWVDRLLVKDPHERPRDAAGVWEELEEIVIGSLGPRWRRDARLSAEGPAPETPKPLTPAPFESEIARRSEPDGGVVEEALEQEPSGYVTFGATKQEQADHPAVSEPPPVEPTRIEPLAPAAASASGSTDEAETSARSPDDGPPSADDDPTYPTLGPGTGAPHSPGSVSGPHSARDADPQNVAPGHPAAVPHAEAESQDKLRVGPMAEHAATPRAGTSPDSLGQHGAQSYPDSHGRSPTPALPGGIEGRTSPTGDRAGETEPGWRRRIVGLGLALAAVLVAVVAVIVVSTQTESSPTASTTQQTTSTHSQSTTPSSVLSAAPTGDLRVTNLVSVPHPSGIAVDRDGSVYVSESQNASVARIDPKTGHVASQIPVGHDPTGIVATDGSLWVANRGDGDVSMIALGGVGSRTKVMVGGAPEKLAYNPNCPDTPQCSRAYFNGIGNVWVTNGDRATLSGLDPGTHKVTTVPLNSQPATDVVSDDNGVFVSTADGKLVKYDNSGVTPYPRSATVSPISAVSAQFGIFLATRIGFLRFNPIDPYHKVTFGVRTPDPLTDVYADHNEGSAWVASKQGKFVERISLDLPGLPESPQSPLHWLNGNIGEVRLTTAPGEVVAIDDRAWVTLPAINAVICIRFKRLPKPTR
jgi:YVTN family beta-propeller protein